MARSFNGSGYVTVASVPVSAKPVSMSCWHWRNTGSPNPVIICLSRGSGGGARDHLYYNIGTSQPVELLQFVSGAFAVVTTSNTGTLDAWNHSGVMFASSGNSKAYLNGTETAGSISTGYPSGMTHTVLGAHILNTGAYWQYTTGRLAEAGIWSVALTTEEFAALAKGMSPRKIRPQSLVYYARLVRDVKEIKGGLAIADGGSGNAVADHPRIYA